MLAWILDFQIVRYQSNSATSEPRTLDPAASTLPQPEQYNLTKNQVLYMKSL